MIKYVHGEYIEMTAEEIEAITRDVSTEDSEPTIIERLEAIEAAILEGVILNG
jgi:hypothetical protein